VQRSARRHRLAGSSSRRARALRQIGVNQLHGHGPFPDPGRTSLGRARADVTCREDALHAGLEEGGDLSAPVVRNGRRHKQRGEAQSERKRRDRRQRERSRGDDQESRADRYGQLRDESRHVDAPLLHGIAAPCLTEAEGAVPHKKGRP
jgi:hypothetical protein